MTRTTGNFICPNCGAVSEAFYYQSGGYHFSHGYGVWDDIEDHLVCTACGAEVDMPEPEPLPDTDEIPF